LVLFGQRFHKHDWLDQLPFGSLVVDLYRACAEPNEELLHMLTLRIIDACAPQAEIHVKACEYANGFLRKHGRKLTDHKISFYYFVDSILVHHDLKYSDGDNFNLISDTAESLTRVISDHRANLEHLDVRIDLPGVSRATLYAACPVAPNLIGLDLTKKKLLWASRLDRQKRPDLLLKIAARLRREAPELRIDLFGSAVLDAFDPAAFGGCPNIAYHGRFDKFEALPLADYDAFLYTAMFDGLPNVVLEAMAAGLPVIAPGVGGIGEAVTEDTGFLVEDSPDDAVLVERYVQAIDTLYQNEQETGKRRANAVALIRKRHSQEAYLQRLSEIFGMPVAAE
jgi:glycosyltransferase involved in cell wall biosynthesis